MRVWGHDDRPHAQGQNGRGCPARLVGWAWGLSFFVRVVLVLGITFAVAGLFRAVAGFLLRGWRVVRLASWQ